MNQHEEHEGRELVREHAESPERFERIEALGKGRDAMLERALNAERQLSEARDGWREEIVKAQSDMRSAESQINRLRERLDEASYQRDVLADAVEQLMTYRPNELSGEDQHEIAVWREVVDALAAVKGGRRE